MQEDSKRDPARIIGLNTENREINEGVIYFDIIFYVRLKSGRSQIIINVEAQTDEPTRYDILYRAIFYVSRMILAQKEREFTGSEYNKIKRVYSIWICMGMKDNTLSHICLTEKQLIGAHRWKGKLDLLKQAHSVALKLFKTGMPMEQIADILETGKEEIRGWLSEITSSECESE